MARDGDETPASVPVGQAIPSVRRTQAERSAAMRQRLLDATVDCLVTYGYGGTTTQRVAEAAGVTRGAQIHHFPSKESLVIAAVEHLAQQRVTAALDSLGTIADGEDTASALLDSLWGLHQGELTIAAIELWVASRTNPVLAEQVRRVESLIVDTVSTVVAQMLPDEAARQDLRYATYTAMDAMRGLLLWNFMAGDEARLQRRWERARRRLRDDMNSALQ
jgi:AcrR family transcriptional regulator